MFRNLFRRIRCDAQALFFGHFVEIKVFYAREFNKVPCVTFIGEIDVTKAFAFIEEKYRLQLRDIYQHCFFNYEDQRMLFNVTVFILNDNRMIELAHNYCQVLHTSRQFDWASNLVKELAQFRQAEEPAKETRVIGFVRQSEWKEN